MNDLHLTEADEAILREPRAFRASSGNLLVNGNWEWPPTPQDRFEAFPIQATWCCQNELVVPEWVCEVVTWTAWIIGCWALGYVVGGRG